MSQRPNNPARIITFIVAVVGGTTLVILIAYWISNSWAIGATAGVISGMLSAVMYPVVFRKR